MASLILSFSEALVLAYPLSLNGLPLIQHAFDASTSRLRTSFYGFVGPIHFTQASHRRQALFPWFADLLYQICSSFTGVVHVQPCELWSNHDL